MRFWVRKLKKNCIFVQTKTPTHMYLYFELKKINDKEGTIRVILSQRGTKAIISTGIKIPIKDWSKGNPKAIGKNGNINLSLGKYKTAFEKYMTNVQLANDLPSLTKGKEYIKGNVKAPNAERGKKDFVALLSEFKADKKGFLKENALKTYTTLINHIIDYNPNTQFADIDEDWSNKFARYLSEKSKHFEGATNLQNTTINKILTTLKVFCKWAHKKKHTSSTDWIEIKKLEETDQRIITLTKDELIQYFNFDFGLNKNLERAKDVFCFASFLGLRFNDLLQVNKHTIKEGKLHINTQKNDKEIQIKLIPEAIDILIKYDYILPLISNQKLNKNIKAGVKKADITRKATTIVQYLNVRTTKENYVHELISIHDARKTFVTLGLEGGLSISEVMQMSTHNDYRSFSRYVNIEQSKIDEKLPSIFSFLKAV